MQVTLRSSIAVLVAFMMMGQSSASNVARRMLEASPSPGFTDKCGCADIADAVCCEGEVTYDNICLAECSLGKATALTSCAPGKCCNCPDEGTTEPVCCEGEVKYKS